MKLLDLLEMLQWKWDKVGTPCPCCYNGYKYGHRDDCEISQKINQLKAARHLMDNNPEFDYKKFFDVL